MRISSISLPLSIIQGKPEEYKGKKEIQTGTEHRNIKEITDFYSTILVTEARIWITTGNLV
jgi:hypothetical protein